MSSAFNITAYTHFANTQLWPLLIEAQKAAVKSIYPLNITKFGLAQFPENLNVIKFFQNTVWGIVGGSVLSAATINLLTQRSKSVVVLQFSVGAFSLYQCDLPFILKCTIASLSALAFAGTSAIEAQKKLESFKQLESDRQYQEYKKSVEKWNMESVREAKAKIESFNQLERDRQYQEYKKGVEKWNMESVRGAKAKFESFNQLERDRQYQEYKKL